MHELSLEHLNYKEPHNVAELPTTNHKTCRLCGKMCEGLHYHLQGNWVDSWPQSDPELAPSGQGEVTIPICSLCKDENEFFDDGDGGVLVILEHEFDVDTAYPIKD